VEHLAIDNNASENALRPIAVGRKNWLFCGSSRAGRTEAMLMSLTASRRAQSIDPLAYLRNLLGRVSTHPQSRIAELLPDGWDKSQFETGRDIERLAPPPKSLGDAANEAAAAKNPRRL
jgi:hypothetical protein